MTTQLRHNGNGFANEKPKKIEALYEMLETHPLRADYNHVATERKYKIHNLPKGVYTHYMGNFEDYSYGFDILTTKGGTVDKKLASLFRANRRKYVK